MPTSIAAATIKAGGDGRASAAAFGRGQTFLTPGITCPFCSSKSGALRNGAPSKDWVPPGGLERIRRKLAGVWDADRQIVDILTAVLSDGLPAVEAACLEALREGVHSSDVVLNILARRRELPAPITDHDPRGAPAAACAGGRLRQIRQPKERGVMERSEILAVMNELKLYGMRAAYDEIITTAVKRQHEPQRIVGDLLTAEITEKQARSPLSDLNCQTSACERRRRFHLR